MADRSERAPSGGAGLVGGGGIITLITANTGTAWALFFRAPTCEVHIVAAGMDSRRTGMRPKERAVATWTPRLA